MLQKCCRNAAEMLQKCYTFITAQTCKIFSSQIFKEPTAGRQASFKLLDGLTNLPTGGKFIGSIDM